MVSPAFIIHYQRAKVGDNVFFLCVCVCRVTKICFMDRFKKQSESSPFTFTDLILELTSFKMAATANQS